MGNPKQVSFQAALRYEMGTFKALACQVHASISSGFSTTFMAIYGTTQYYTEGGTRRDF